MRWLNIVLVPAEPLGCALIRSPPTIVPDPKVTFNKGKSKGEAQFILFVCFLALQAMSWVSGYKAASLI